MAYSILTSKDLIGKSYDDIRNIFGPNDGFFITDTVPAYIIQEGKTHQEDTWQIVFLMDKTSKVKKY